MAYAIARKGAALLAAAASAEDSLAALALDAQPSRPHQSTIISQSHPCYICKALQRLPCSMSAVSRATVSHSLWRPSRTPSRDSLWRDRRCIAVAGQAAGSPPDSPPPLPPAVPRRALLSSLLLVPLVSASSDTHPAAALTLEDVTPPVAAPQPLSARCYCCSVGLPPPPLPPPPPAPLSWVDLSTCGCHSSLHLPQGGGCGRYL